MNNTQSAQFRKFSLLKLFVPLNELRMYIQVNMYLKNIVSEEYGKKQKRCYIFYYH